MRKLSLLLFGAALAMPALSWAAVIKGVEGSQHDFSGTNHITWNTRRGVCSVCHTAHDTDPNVVPLWAHRTTGATFTMYSSPTFLGSSDSHPNGPSLACLSCHDGTLAINDVVKSSRTNLVMEYVQPNHVIGTDLRHSHPVSFTYDAALAALDGEIENPTTYHIGDPKTSIAIQTPPVPTTWLGTDLTGKTIDQALLINHKIECETCHDPHWIKGNSPFRDQAMIIDGNDADGRGSLECRTCHIK